jgi:hypothetical protein
MANWAWYEERPERVQEAIRQCPPTTCLRGSGERGHYWVNSYDEGDDGTVTIEVEHGCDSVLPGLQVFGVLPCDLHVCDCGNWEGV